MNNLSKENKLVISIFLLFIITSCAGSISNIFEIPIFLSSMQLVILLLIFFIPFVLRTFYMKLNDFYMVIANSTLFQSIWLTLQTLNNGHLNRDIEVFLFSSKISIQSSENSNLLRLPGTFYESSILGTFLITNISILILYLINNNKIQMRKKTMIFLSIAMGTIAIILTGSRAIYLISFLILIILLKTKHCLSKDKIKALILSIKKIKLIIPIIFAILFVWPYFINRISSANQVFSKEGSGSYRIQLSEYALKLTDKKPLFGVGLNLSEFYLATSFPGEDYFFDAAYPHNIIIQILAETGLVGITLFIYFIYLILFRPTIKRNLNNFNEFHLASIVFLMCAQFYPIFINHMEIISYLFLYLGFAAFSNQKKIYEK
ncbi:MAG: O-antigen ligase family protein [Pseudomonadales bacterium]|nr:O-antigen ligase family protein [Pseudomonadales bacterium]